MYTLGNLQPGVLGVGHYMSEIRDLLSGVIQGSNIGPQAGRRLVRSLLTVCDIAVPCIHGPMSIIN